MMMERIYVKHPWVTDDVYTQQCFKLSDLQSMSRKKSNHENYLLFHLCHVETEKQRHMNKEQTEQCKITIQKMETAFLMQS